MKKSSTFSWAGPFNVSDISCMCHLWKNCKMFDIAESTMQRLMKVRNEYFAHNSEVTLPLTQKMEVFDALFDLVAEKDMQAYLDVKQCRRELEQIQDKEYVPVLEVINELKREVRNVNTESTENKREFNQAFDRLLDTTDEIQAATTRLLEQTYEINVAKKEIFHFLRQNNKRECAILLLAGLAILFLLIPFPSLHDSRSVILLNTNKGSEHNRGCLSEQYSFPFPQDLPLLNFLGQHQKLVGQEWLFRELEDIVLKNDNLRGVMFLANIGYGKSAIIRHLLCAGEGEKGYELRQHVKAFHVCKFDSRSTRLLIGFLATFSAECGSIIEYQGNNSLFYDLSACEYEIEACFDQAVTHPLQEITGDMKPVSFAIDALDECYDSNKETNPIMDILQSRIPKLPKWFKVVITARNVTISARLKRHLRLRNLQFSDSNNIADIKEFISESNITKTAKAALYQSEGNFQYVNKLLENKDSINNYRDLPQSLEEIYEEKFSRHFGTTERYFDTAKRILEIVCASMCSLKVPQIMQVLGVNNDSYNSFNEVFDKLFTFCLTETDIGIVFVHQSIYTWVISDRNENYKISVTRGHEMIAKYMLSASHSNESQIDIVKLAIHVASSGKDKLKKLFYSLRTENVHHLLHHAVKNGVSSC